MENRGPFTGIIQGMPRQDYFGHQPPPQPQNCHSSAIGAQSNFYQNPQTNMAHHALPNLQNFPCQIPSGQCVYVSRGNEYDRQSSHENGLPLSSACYYDSAACPDPNLNSQHPILSSQQVTRWIGDGAPIDRRIDEAPIERRIDAASYLGPEVDQGAWRRFDELQQTMGPYASVECGPASVLQAHPPAYAAEFPNFQDGQIASNADRAYEETLPSQLSGNYIYWHESRPPEKLRKCLPPHTEIANTSPFLMASTEAFAAFGSSESPGNEAAMDFIFDDTLAMAMAMADLSSEPNAETVAASQPCEPRCFVNRAPERHQDVVRSPLPSCSSGDSSSNEGKTQRKRKTKARQTKSGESEPPERPSPGALTGSTKQFVHAYPGSVQLEGRDKKYHSIELRPDLATSAKTGPAMEVPQAVQIQVLQRLDESNYKFWSIVESPSEHEPLDPKDRRKWGNIISCSRRQMKEKRPIAMDKHVPALIGFALRNNPGAAQVVANNPVVQSLIRLAILRGLIDPMEGSNARRFKANALHKKIVLPAEVQDYVDKIKQANGFVDPYYLCLAAASNLLVKEGHVAGRPGYEFICDATLNAVLALLFVHNAIADYENNLKLLQFHVSAWPLGVVGVLELIRHEDTLYRLGLSLTTSPIHFDLECFCTELIARAQPFIERGEGAPPALVQMMHNHLPANSQHDCANLSALATAYFHIIDKPGWRSLLQPFCSHRHATSFSIDGRQFNLAYVGKQQTYEYEQKHYGLPSYIHIFMVAEQANGYQASAYLREPKIEFSEIRQFFNEATGGGFDPREIQFYCLATVSGFVAFGAAMFNAKIVSERSPWGLLELIVTASDMPTLSTSHVSVSGGMPNSELPMMCLKPAALNIRALYLRIDVSTAGVSSLSSLFSGSDITSTVFAMLGLDTPEALNALGNLAVSCFPLEKPHRLEGLFDDQTLWPKPEFFRAINCNLQTMNQDLLWHMLRGRSDDNLHYQGHLHILELCNNNFASDTFVAVGPLLVEMCKQLRDLSLCFCSLQKDVLMGIIDLAFCGEESKLEYLSLDGNQLLRDGQVFDVLYGHLTNMRPGAPTKLKRLSMTDIDFSAQQEDLLYAWATRQNEAVKSKFYADISQTAAASVAAGVVKAPKFVEPVMITRLNQPSSSARAIPGTRCHNAVDMDWFNSIPKHKNFRDHFEIIWS